MRGHTWRLMASCIVLLVPCGAAWGATLTAADMFLDPSAIPPANYAYSYFSSGYTAQFTGVQRLQVLPALQDGSNAYYFTPTVDYTGDITGANGSITFNRPGPYFVLATNTNNTQTLFDYGIGFQVFPAETGPTYNWHQTTVPAADDYVIDPSLAASQPTFPQGSTVKNNLATWNDVLNFLKTLTNAHVELSGHGAPGQFYYAGVDVLDSSMLGTLDQLVGHVECLTFMSCLTAQGAAGSAFLQGVANKLGTSAGYTDCVGGNGTNWFYNDSAKYLTFTAVPEPPSLVLIVLGLAGIAIPARRRGRAA
jgi:hypothetical protein